MADPTDPAPEDPTRFPANPEVEPLDEAPDGTTPSDPNERDLADHPPGFKRDRADHGNND
ncbi:MAG: hypothetical protein M3Z03_01060 [Actinomycetota bacterium]|nr:hypothetical protein [Actinomycetota bacterium]